MEMMEELIRPELLVLIPVLYFLGLGLHKMAAFEDRWIPLALGAAGIALALAYLVAAQPVSSVPEIAMLIFAGVTQGILCAGCSLFAEKLITRSKKDDPS